VEGARNSESRQIVGEPTLPGATSIQPAARPTLELRPRRRSLLISFWRQKTLTTPLSDAKTGEIVCQPVQRQR
jgi:hypothetical protein